MSNAAHGTVSHDVGPNVDDGLYSLGANEELTASPGSDRELKYWLVNGVPSGNTNRLLLTMNAHKTVLAVIDWIPRTISVTNTNDTGTGSLRAALTDARDNDTITLPTNGTITLTSVLPNITTSITIEGNGTTLTQSGITPDTLTQLLVISPPSVVKISRLHFKGGRATTYAGGLRNNGNLTLESCIFSDNQATTGGSGNGGAIVSGNSDAILTVLGCTFYNNQPMGSSGKGGAIYFGGAALTLTGNLFIGNTATTYPVVYNTGAGTVTSGGYNVSDKADGLFAFTSGFTGVTGDVFGVTGISFDGASKPTSAGSTNLKTLTGLPSGFPTTYFDGTSRTTLPATAGAVEAD
ncbi:hypothetical protein AGMMS49944_27550 [Spirochaetia bacterium]|nr:hypothetical protein AGMMS49944_27550 [Spirochaetia bacterium]